MSGTQDLVGLSLLALVIADAWTDENRPALQAMVSGDGPVGHTHAAVVKVGAELLGATVLTVVAGTSPKAATSCLVISLALWVLWFVHGGANRPGSLANSFDPFRVPGQLRPPAPVGPPVGTGKTPTGAGGQPYSKQTPGLPAVP